MYSIYVKQLQELFLISHMCNTYTLLDILVWSITLYFYEWCCILTSPQGKSKYKQWVKIYSDTSPEKIQ